MVLTASTIYGPTNEDLSSFCSRPPRAEKPRCYWSMVEENITRGRERGKDNCCCRRNLLGSALLKESVERSVRDFSSKEIKINA